MQDAAAFMAQDQSARRRIEIRPLALVLLILILKWMVGVRVWEGGPQEVVGYSPPHTGNCLRQGIQAVGGPRTAIRHAGEERSVFPRQFDGIAPLERRHLLLRETPLPSECVEFHPEGLELTPPRGSQ